MIPSLLIIQRTTPRTTPGQAANAISTEALSESLSKKSDWAWCCSLVITAFGEVEATRLGLSRPALAAWGLVSTTVMPLKRTKLAVVPSSLFGIFYHKNCLWVVSDCSPFCLSYPRSIPMPIKSSYCFQKTHSPSSYGSISSNSRVSIFLLNATILNVFKAKVLLKLSVTLFPLIFYVFW